MKIALRWELLNPVNLPCRLPQRGEPRNRGLRSPDRFPAVRPVRQHSWFALERRSPRAKVGRTARPPGFRPAEEELLGSVQLTDIEGSAFRPCASLLQLLAHLTSNAWRESMACTLSWGSRGTYKSFAPTALSAATRALRIASSVASMVASNTAESNAFGSSPAEQ
jgi:hypothetical protein